MRYILLSLIACLTIACGVSNPTWAYAKIGDSGYIGTNADVSFAVVDVDVEAGVRWVNSDPPAFVVPPFQAKRGVIRVKSKSREFDQTYNVGDELPHWLAPYLTAAEKQALGLKFAAAPPTTDASPSATEEGGTS